MAEKKEKQEIDVQTFVDHINKKDVKHNGNKIHFAFVNRKRKGLKSLSR